MLLVIKRVRVENAKEATAAQQEARRRCLCCPTYAMQLSSRADTLLVPSLPLRQVRMLAELNHPFVVGYIDSFMHKDHLCIVTECAATAAQSSLPRGPHTRTPPAA